MPAFPFLGRNRIPSQITRHTVHITLKHLRERLNPLPCVLRSVSPPVSVSPANVPPKLNSSHLICIIKGSVLLCDSSIGFKQSTAEFRELEGASLVSLVEMIKEKKKNLETADLTLHQLPVVSFQVS